MYRWFMSNVEIALDYCPHGVSQGYSRPGHRRPSLRECHQDDFLWGSAIRNSEILHTTTQYSVVEIGGNMRHLLDMGVFNAKAPYELKGYAQLAVCYASASGFCLAQLSVNVQRQVPYSCALSLSKQLMGFYRLTVWRRRLGCC